MNTRFRKLTAWLLTIAMLATLSPMFTFTALAENTAETLASDDDIFASTRTDFRDESVYTLMITRFYDGDSGNNVHCWDDAQAGNTDSDPAWRGDFKGLIEKLDYIRALGFTAIRLNPVAQNASGYDYHGGHPINMKKVDFRYESDGYTYEDLIAACHERGMKVLQNVVLNSTSNFGEENLMKLFTVNENADLSNMQEALTPTQLLLDTYGLASAEEYWAQLASNVYFQRINLIKNNDYSSGNSTGSLPADSDYDISKLSLSETYNPDNYYHSGYYQTLNWDDWTSQFAQIAGDCVDLNTENPSVGLYLAEACKLYADMGVDAICIKDAKHISRLSLNLNIIEPLRNMLAEDGKEMEIFFESATRYTQTWYREHAEISIPFYTWAESDSKWSEQWMSGSDAESINTNTNLVFDHIRENDDISDEPESNNAFLDGLTYHTPDYSKASGMKAVDFTMMYVFGSASGAFALGQNEDKYINDSTWNLTGLEFEDYAPDGMDSIRYNLSEENWAEGMSLLFTFRGIPSIMYGSEIAFQAGAVIDVGPNAPLSETGRAYYGDHLEGNIEAWGFGEYSASGAVAETLDTARSQHLKKLNAIRQAIPALRKGQYTTSSDYVSGNTAFIRRYTDETQGIDSLALVTITNGATFKNIPNGKYIDAVSGDVQNVTDGTLSIAARSSIGELAVYVCCADGFTGIDGAIVYGDTQAPVYTATFDANGGSGTMESITSSNSYIILPECTFTSPNGEAFEGWSVNGNKKNAGDRVYITDNVTISALWKNTSSICTVSFDANGGSGTMESIPLEAEEYTLPKCRFTAPDGMMFKAWSINEVEYAAGDKIQIDGNITVTAIWQSIFLGIPSNTILFNNTDGWTTVNAYMWNGDGWEMKTWPGTKMTNIAGTDIWYIEVPEEAVNIIFNNGSTQTGDMIIPTDGKNMYTYSSGQWSVYEIADDSYSIDTPHIGGSFNEWTLNAMNDDDNDGIWEYTMDLAAGTYEFKLAAESGDINLGGGAAQPDTPIDISVEASSNIIVEIPENMKVCFKADFNNYDPYTGNGATITVSIIELLQAGVILTADKVYANSGDLQNAVLIVASYTDNVLTDIKIISDVSINYEKSLSEIGLETEGATTVKAFLWKNITSLVPVSKAQTTTTTDI